MRVLLALCLLVWPVAARADTYPIDMSKLPNPPGCADYQKNATGTADADCNAAIDHETDPAAKSMLLFRRAFIEDAPGDFSKYGAALSDLDLSIKLYPQNWASLHERAYIYVEYGRWADAQADLDAQIVIDKNDPAAFRERALARFHLGDLRGSYDDRDASIAAGDRDYGAYLARARAGMWLGRFGDAKSDIALAQQMADDKAAGEIDALQAELALWATTSSAAAQGCVLKDMPSSDDNKNLVGDCTRAFLDATTGKARADALTSRSEAWLILQRDTDKWVRDLEIAAALDPENAGVLSNLGYAYVRQRHSTAALPLFDRSVALEPAYYNYAGRASAKAGLGDIDGALADARKSYELRPNDIALTVLGDMTYAKTKSYDKAKPFWIAAYHLGDRDDGLIARLKDAGVPIPPPDAKP
jgi:tetratricopeptide (TPR) repeat protein